MLDKFIGPLILVMEDVHETRDGIEKLLTADGYRVAPARDELDTIESAQHTQPGSNTGEPDGINWRSSSYGASPARAYGGAGPNPGGGLLR